MAGDWLKMEVDLPEKPEVWQIASIVGIDADSVVGKLLKVWRWFDAHTEDGNALGVTYPLVDHVAGVTGFAEAMALCGWLVQNGSVMSIPHFDRHNGKTAKNRALTAKRVAKCKEKGNGEGNGASVTHALPREEKRREEDKSKSASADLLRASKAPSEGPTVDSLLAYLSPQVVSDFKAHRRAKKAPITVTALEGIQREAAKARMTLEAALAMCCERGWTGFKAEWVAGANAAPTGPVPPRRKELA